VDASDQQARWYTTILKITSIEWVNENCGFGKCLDRMGHWGCIALEVQRTDQYRKIQEYRDSGWSRLALKYWEYYFLLQNSFDSKLTQPAEQEHYDALG
jgi:hypothetical protein